MEIGNGRQVNNTEPNYEHRVGEYTIYAVR